MWFMGQGMQNPNQVGAGAHPYMHLMGIVALGLMWLRMAKAAGAALADGGEDKAFLDAKLVTARYFADRIMPEAGALRRKIEGGSEATMALPPAMFAAGYGVEYCRGQSRGHGRLWIEAPAVGET